MGTAHKVVSACFRVVEFGCAVIILGILARLFRLIDLVNGNSNSRLEYALSMAAISVALSILLVPPMKYSFYCFPLDFALFVCWIVCFALLEDLAGKDACSSAWYRGNWAAYWSGSRGNTVVTTGAGCARWRTVLAFSFIVAFFFFASAWLGLYASVEYHNFGSHFVSLVRKCTWWKKPKEGDIEKDAPLTEETQRLPDVAPNGV